MKFDVILSNPPYTNTNKFCRIIKNLNADNNIILVPLSSMRDVTYNNVEWVDFPDIGIGNIHIIDLNGDINEYFSSTPAPFWSNDEKDNCFIVINQQVKDFSSGVRLLQIKGNIL